MGADNLQFEFTPRDAEDRETLRALFLDADSAFFSNCRLTTRNDGSIVLNFEEGNQLQIEHHAPLFWFIAAYSDPLPTANGWSSATGEVYPIPDVAEKTNVSEAEREQARAIQTMAALTAYLKTFGSITAPPPAGAQPSKRGFSWVHAFFAVSAVLLVLVGYGAYRLARLIVGT